MCRRPPTTLSTFWTLAAGPPVMMRMKCAMPASETSGELTVIYSCMVALGLCSCNVAVMPGICIAAILSSQLHRSLQHQICLTGKHLTMRKVTLVAY